MGFPDIFLADLNAVLADIGELVIYTPKGGTPKPIYALIDRTPDSRIPEAQEGISNSAVILVSRADVPAINLDGDTFTFSMIVGRPADAYTARLILADDSAQWKLRVS